MLKIGLTWSDKKIFEFNKKIIKKKEITYGRKFLRFWEENTIIKDINDKAILFLEKEFKSPVKIIKKYIHLLINLKFNKYPVFVLNIMQGKIIDATYGIL